MTGNDMVSTMLEIIFFISMLYNCTIGVGKNTLGVGEYHSFYYPLLKLQWIISLIYEYFKYHKGTLINSMCIHDVYYDIDPHYIFSWI
jgi:hypothetical protein